MRFSVDTNVFAYAADDRNLTKQGVARDLVETLLSRDTWIGLQVVGELQNVLRRRFGKTAKEAVATSSFVLGSFSSFPFGEDDVEAALNDSMRGELSYWDSLLVHAAGKAECDMLFSEDMQDGRRYGRVVVINPFGMDGLSANARGALFK